MKTPLIKSGLAFTIICLVFSGAYAQIKRPHLLVGANVSYFNPQANFAEQYKFGVGGEVSGGIGVDKTFLVATLGTGSFFSDNKITAANLTVKPVKIGIRQFFLAKRIFINGDVGMASVKDKTVGSTQKQFIRGAGAGVRLFGLEAGLYYSGWKSINAAGFSNSVQVKIGWGMAL